MSDQHEIDWPMLPRRVRPGARALGDECRETLGRVGDLAIEWARDPTINARARLHEAASRLDEQRERLLAYARAEMERAAEPPRRATITVETECSRCGDLMSIAGAPPIDTTHAVCSRHVGRGGGVRRG